MFIRRFLTVFLCAVVFRANEEVSGFVVNPMLTTTTTTTTTTTLPPVIQQIADERKEFQMNLGRAMDVLRRDMPDILHKPPDFSIYHNDISVIDPSGVQLTGIDKYQSAIHFFQTFCHFWFAPTTSTKNTTTSSSSSSRSTVQYRMVYDFCRSSIRISWNMRLVPKHHILPTVYMDGVSIYKLDAASGKIIQHKVEKLVLNNTPVAPPYGMVSLLQQPLPAGLTTATS